MAPDLLGITLWTTFAAGSPIAGLCYGVISALLARGEPERQEAIVSTSEFRT
ncbi:hypothetical protein [Nocardioides zeae]|uniref:Uncharacterized protein n=1 Tax=Nocardioides zeae TaxID=1457234 RepID=A0A6P0HEX6_9ACTN|nr:hypothetical protein [Nocardioides zeae]NEN76857.1 hypothetical protein [Nocardioides zeae]